jgi:hypothetical protein
VGGGDSRDGYHASWLEMTARAAELRIYEKWEWGGVILWY